MPRKCISIDSILKSLVVALENIEKREINCISHKKVVTLQTEIKNKTF